MYDIRIFIYTLYNINFYFIYIKDIKELSTKIINNNNVWRWSWNTF